MPIKHQTSHFPLPALRTFCFYQFDYFKNRLLQVGSYSRCLCDWPVLLSLVSPRFLHAGAATKCPFFLRLTHLHMHRLHFAPWFHGHHESCCCEHGCEACLSENWLSVLLDRYPEVGPLYHFVAPCLIFRSLCTFSYCT